MDYLDDCRRLVIEPLEKFKKEVIRKNIENLSALRNTMRNY